MKEDSKSWIQSCGVCQQFGRPAVQAKFSPIFNDCAFQVIVVNFVGPFSDDGPSNNHIFSVFDVHIRFSEIFAVEHRDA